jgi:hypothetical protein
MSTENVQDDDKEFAAMRQVYTALKDLNAAAQNRVLDYVIQRLSLVREPARAIEQSPSQSAHPPVHSESRPGEVQANARDSGDETVEGISPIAQKWMRRSGITSEQMSSLFSLGIDEIDLVAQSVPGRSKADRVRSVMLLQGIAGYLSSGVARVSNDKLREACSHYDAYDVTNFSKHLRAISAEASGSRESGYTLTSRGIAAATDLIKQIAARQ